MTVLMLGVSIGVQLLLSAVTKLRDFSTFFTIFNTYNFPNMFKKRFFAFAVVTAEAFLGIALLSLHGKAVRYGLVGTALFLFLAGVLIGFRLQKGERKFRCGCGQSLDEEQNAMWLLIRNFFLLGVVLLGLGEAPATVSLLTVEALYIFMAGIGLLVTAKLIHAGFTVIYSIRQWTASG